jgi:hypothetical protein
MWGSGCPHCSTTASDNDAIYIWRAVGQSFNGHPVYKIGITSSRLGDQRIEQVAKATGFDAEIVVMVQVENARHVEEELHTLGHDPQYVGHDGATEFRALSDDDLSLALDFVRDGAAQFEAA